MLTPAKSPVHDLGMVFLRRLALFCAILSQLSIQACGDSPGQRAQSGETRIYEGLFYGDPGDEPDAARRSLDLYLPPSSRTLPPLLIFVHGGFWVMGDENFQIGSSLARELVARGVAVALVRYRLGPKHRHPAQVEDVAAAVAYLAKEAGRYGYDSARVYLAGHSAGAHLAALAALDESYLRARGLGPGTLAGVIGISGIYELSGRGEFSLDQQRAIEETFGGDPEALREASPVNHVKPGAPPFLLMSAAGDLFGFNVDTRRFSDALNTEGKQRTIPMVLGERDHLSLPRMGGSQSIARDLLLDFLKVKPLSGYLGEHMEARRTWLETAPSTLPFWKHRDLVRNYPIDERFLYGIAGHYGASRHDLLNWSLDKFQAMGLMAYLDSLPPEKRGGGDYLVLRNLRDEMQVWRTDEIRPYDPVIVVGIDDERNLFRLGGFYRMQKEYSWKEGARPPVMVRPVGAFIYFLKPPPPSLAPQAWHFALTEESFRLVAENPLGSLKAGLPNKLYEVMTFRNGCIYCHTFRGIGSRSHHILAAGAGAHGGFALPLEEYSPEVWKAFVFNQEAVASKMGAVPNVIEEGAREPLYRLVLQSRERGDSVIFRQ